MIYLSNDHAGFKLKGKLKKYLENKNHMINDLGPEKLNKKDDYPDYAKVLCKKVLKNKSKGILICGSGHGMVITANKFKGIYATVCWNSKSAKYAKAHTNINVLCLPARFVTESQAKAITNQWLKTKFSKDERHKKRINKIKKIEK